MLVFMISIVQRALRTFRTWNEISGISNLKAFTGRTIEKIIAITCDATEI